VKLFQIEEPDGGPVDPSAPGAAIGLDASGIQVEVGFSVGSNSVILGDREGFEKVVPVPGATADQAEWHGMFEAARTRAERALSRPVTHAVVVFTKAPEADMAGRLHNAAALAGLQVLRLAAIAELPGGSTPALAAAILAEDLAPRPD